METPRDEPDLIGCEVVVKREIFFFRTKNTRRPPGLARTMRAVRVSSVLSAFLVLTPTLLCGWRLVICHALGRQRVLQAAEDLAPAIFTATHGMAWHGMAAGPLVSSSSAF